MDELKKFSIDKLAFDELKQISSMASSIAGGAVAGALTAIGAYGGAMTLGACATTGTAIATLSGTAATNATLAFLGVGALSVGGLGMAGGTMVLGGLVAGLALAVMGFVVGAKASANREESRANLAKAREYEEEVKTLQVLCKAIRMRANMFERFLIKLDDLFEPLTESLAKIVKTRGTDFSQYSKEEKAVVAANLSVAKAVKAVLDTPILTEDGNLTDESEDIVEPVQKMIAANATAESFPCSRCGECCRHINLILQLAHFDRGDGVCIHLRENLCSIYVDRPEICRVDKMFTKFFSEKYSRETFYKLNLGVCLELQKQANAKNINQNDVLPYARTQGNPPCVRHLQ